MLISDSSNPPAHQPSQNTMHTFMGMLAHEMRTSISGICMATNMLLQDKLGTRDKEFYLSSINAMGLDVLHILNNMMASSMVNAGKLEIKPILSTIHIRKWLKSYIDQQNRLVKSKLVSIRLTFNRKVPEYLTTDTIKLTQILKNLIENAFQYSPVGSRISVYVGSVGETGIFFLVTDKGTGISSDQMHLLFQPFQSFNNGFTGTGLGLYISKLYAQALGGDLTLANTDNNGTSFFLQIVNQSSI
ncbi:sensor histidine kinase [Chitinophaga filiformis]|uniref:histidine kinase n=1 Tax=Chitinophaga filiformis TaxID=104663 RepID=A0A1G8EA25_CHIFI|nr:HAMP domain-containing sensor histidine kinase [Chitinophaga filiformis]SDH66600.1 His Kinase A (phospho-acceptor) domain-containing protein [Chitinophaga filiformis]